MRLLAIETATDVCSVAISRDDDLLSECTLTLSRKLAESLAPMIENQLRFLPFGPGDLDAIAVSIGPGSFTGLRIGLSTAKGLLFDSSVELLAIPTLGASAWSVRDRADQVQVLHHSHRDSYFFASYGLHKRLTIIEPPHRDKLSALRDLIDPEIPLFVDRPAELPADSQLDRSVLIGNGVCAASVASLAFSQPDRWSVDDPYQIEPDYLWEYEAVKYKNPMESE